MKEGVVILLAALVMLYPISLLTAQPVQSERVTKLIETLNNEVNRLQAFVQSRVTNTTKQQELLQDLQRVKEMLNNASSLAGAGNYNESLQVLREVRAELVSIARKLVPEVLSARKHFVTRSIEAEIRALDNQVRMLENLSLRFQQKGVDTSNLTSLISEARSLLSEASGKLNSNDTSTALQLVSQAWEKVKEAEKTVYSLATQLRLKSLSKDLERLKGAFNTTYDRLKRVSPQQAEEFEKWASERLAKINSLMQAGKYGEALALLRTTIFQYRGYEVSLIEYARLQNLVQTARQLATVIRPCNATLAEKLLSTADDLNNSLKSKNTAGISDAAAELRSLIAQARFACRRKPVVKHP